MASHPEFDDSTEGVAVVSAFPTKVEGRVFLITGVSEAGIGGATAKALASGSPKLLILTGRSEARVKPVIADINKRYPGVGCRFLSLDLASASSVRKAAAEVDKYSENIDVLINNAGIAQVPERRLNDAGMEMHFATNHIGHFLFTNLILHKLEAAAKASEAPGSVRIVNVSSMAHQFGPVRFSDINFDNPVEALPEDERPNVEATKAWDPNDRPYNSMAAYAQSKTANILFSVTLNEKLQSQGIKALAVDPGVVRTEVLRDTSTQLQQTAEKMLAGKWRTIEQGASTLLVAALDDQITAGAGGVYLAACQISDSAAWATDRDAAEKLWFLSERLSERTASA